MLVCVFAEGRGLHMSDEEGEVFDNRWLKELSDTPRQNRGESGTLPPGQRLSELRWRNSLCPPHLKSSYPAEMQFRETFDEEEIKVCNNILLKTRFYVLLWFKVFYTVITSPA